MAALMCVACTSESTLEPVTPIAPIGNDPIAFTGAYEGPATRSSMPSNMLRSGFVVSTFKNYSATSWDANVNTVMPRYMVDYKENRDDWNGVVISNWNYVNVNNLFTGNRQEEKFWDYSGFPYRFHALAPANGNTITTDHITKLDNNELFIKATYHAQTFTAPAITTSGSESPSVSPSNQQAEPYLLAQVSRNNNGEDYDIIKNKAINTESTSKNRRVWLPFHHLNSKVRFAIYTDNLMQTARIDYIKDLTIWAEHLATKATGYKAYGSDAWTSQSGYSYFSDIKVNDKVEIFKYNCTPTSTSPSRSYEQNNLSLHQSRGSAYFLECPDGIMQLPQNDIKLHVTMKIMDHEGNETTHFYDYEITKENNVGTDADPTHWIAGCIHTYYIHLNFDDLKLPIMTITCTLTPWEDVSGSLSTDLEQ